MIRELNSSDWPTFCQRINQQRAGAVVKLEILEANGVKSERVPGAALHSLILDKTGGCNDVITLRLSNDREISHEIIEPLRFLLHPTGAGDFNPLQIEAESGVTFITIHPAIHTQMLDGLKTS